MSGFLKNQNITVVMLGCFLESQLQLTVYLRSNMLTGLVGVQMPLYCTFYTRASADESKFLSSLQRG